MLCRHSLRRLSRVEARDLLVRGQIRTSKTLGFHAAILNMPKIVGYWLAGCGGMCFVAVTLGGVTRLTESGLSMVDWKLFGRPPPFTNQQWKSEFEKYQTSPEFLYKNSDISLSDFKFIWWMEYGHRMWGRLIGCAFAGPAIYFLSRGWLNRKMKFRVGLMGSLIAFQGLLGWYMVKSGLDHQRFDNTYEIPRVSQYRLAAHLSTAMVLYSLFVSSALTILRPKVSYVYQNCVLNRLKNLGRVSKALVFCTAVSGAFVAGLDAGYNCDLQSFSWMTKDVSLYHPWTRNLTENPYTVLTQHIILAVSTFVCCNGLAYYVMLTTASIPRYLTTPGLVVGMMASIQASLGLASLQFNIPTPLAAMHQGCALLTLTAALVFSHRVKLTQIRSIVKR